MLPFYFFNTRKLHDKGERRLRACVFGCVRAGEQACLVAFRADHRVHTDYAAYFPFAASAASRACFFMARFRMLRCILCSWPLRRPTGITSITPCMTSCQKKPFVHSTLPILFTALFAKTSGFGTVSDGRILLMLDETKCGQTDWTKIPCDLYSVAKACEK